MARILIKIEKDDVITSKLGNNIQIKCDNNIDIVFSPEALEELLNDYYSIKLEENSKKDIELEAIDFTTKKLKNVSSLLTEDYKVGYKEGIQHYLESIKP